MNLGVPIVCNFLYFSYLSLCLISLYFTCLSLCLISYFWRLEIIAKNEWIGGCQLFVMTKSHFLLLATLNCQHEWMNLGVPIICNSLYFSCLSLCLISIYFSYLSFCLISYFWRLEIINKNEWIWGCQLFVMTKISLLTFGDLKLSTWMNEFGGANCL